MEADDSLIVDELKKGSDTGIRLMVGKYQDRLYNWGKRHYDALNDHDIREIIDDTFLRVIDAIESFQFRSEKAFRAWILTIFTNLAMDCFRKRGRIAEHIREESYDDDVSNSSQQWFPTIRQELDRKIYQDYLSPQPNDHPLAATVRIFMEGLEEEERIILHSCVMGISHRQITEWTGIPKEHVKVYYYRLKKKLEKYLLNIKTE